MYIRILTSQYAEEEIRGEETELVAAFLKSIKAESSEKETALAIKGIHELCWINVANIAKLSFWL